MAIPEYGTLEARREAREAVSRPGKFEGEPPITFILCNIMLDGGTDGDAFMGEGEWASRIGRFVLAGDNYGFISSTRYPTTEAAQAIIDSINEQEFQSEYSD